MKQRKILIIRIIVTVFITLLLYYFLLPPLNLTAPEFYLFLFLIFLVYSFTSVVKVIDIRNTIVNASTGSFKFIYYFLAVLLASVLILIINLIFSPLFMSDAYAKRIIINKDSDFTTDVLEVDFNSIALLDKDSSRKLGDRVMGEMTELVSQFDVSDLYTQINYNSDIVRVTPLDYADWIKYFTNRNNGVSGYIMVNSVTGDSNLVKLDEGMKYTPNALFFENLYRYLRIKYPTEILGEESFEIDNEGNPYWIVPTIKYTAVGLMEEVSGVIIVNPINGDTKKYMVGEVPTWVDHVYPANLILNQVDNWGKYQDGFWNSIFGQKGVVKPTDGYNYLAMNDDVYLYTGITSAVKDSSNLGFILTNMRTKETSYYAVAGAEEYSAMASAEGQVQQMSYSATFPLLINLRGRPTYLISLKDNAGLVKMYAFVDVLDYQKVSVTEASYGIEKAASNYLNNLSFENTTNELFRKNIVIKEINQAIIDGITYYYLIDNDLNKYRVSIKVNDEILGFIKVGDVINVSYMVDSEVKNVVEVNDEE
ncbi:MAG: CvpA family protein [bacterium]|nr:CvpA family protein [bacterium]